MTTHARRTACCLLGTILLTTALSAAALEWDALRVCADPNSMPLSNDKGQGYENRIAELLAADLGVPLEYTWFPQRMGFIRNTLRAPDPSREGYKCDVVMGVPEGFDLVVTTKPYYRSTYALVFKKKQAGLENIHSVQEFLALDDSVKKNLRIGIFAGTPAASWLSHYGLMKQAIAFPAMSGDPAEYPGQLVERELMGGNIDVAILWGPIAGYFTERLQAADLALLPLASESGIRFDFAIAMGVRYGDKERKQALEELIDRNADKIEAILKEYNVPLLEKTTNVQ